MVLLRMIPIRISIEYTILAEWQSGHAADCNSVNIGSIPFSASITSNQMKVLFFQTPYAHNLWLGMEHVHNLYRCLAKAIFLSTHTTS